MVFFVSLSKCGGEVKCHIERVGLGGWDQICGEREQTRVVGMERRLRQNKCE